MVPLRDNPFDVSFARIPTERVSHSSFITIKLLLPTWLLAMYYPCLYTSMLAVLGRTAHVCTIFQNIVFINLQINEKVTQSSNFEWLEHTLKFFCRKTYGLRI